MPEEMPEYNVIITWEAIYDMADIIDYIEAEFGRVRADRFQDDIKKEMTELEYMGSVFPKTQILYRNYSIYKKPFPPSIIFYVLMKQKQEIHVLRVLREESDWQHILNITQNYTYPT